MARNLFVSPDTTHPVSPIGSLKRAQPLRRRASALLISTAALFPLGLATEAQAATSAAHSAAALARATASIHVDQLSDHVRLLADDTLEGREAGSRGGYTAGNYLVRHFQGGLEPAGGSGQFFQLFAPNFRNILGVLPGSDPQLEGEYILVGAHYDHVGYGNPSNSQGPLGLIHNGADDNASGTAAMLELIEAFRESGLQPRRSILFALWDGEEKGLLGSQHFIQQPTVPLERIKFVINIDMIGRLDKQRLEVLGSRTSKGLRSLVTQANQQSELQLQFPWKIEANSDHHPFFVRQIPFLMFHTGLHDDYHRPSDDTERLNTEGIEAIARLIFQTTWKLANEEQLAAYRAASTHETEAAQKAFEQPGPAPPPRLGIQWTETRDAESLSLKITSVQIGSDADRSGLRVGGTITHLNGKALQSAEDLKRAVVSASQLELTIVRDGESEPQIRTVAFSTPPARIGISWREDSAEPGTITIVRVLPHSSADQAGLQPGDRVYQVAGQTFQDSNEFTRLMQSLELPVAILVERSGQLVERTLPSSGEMEESPDAEESSR